MILSRLAPIIVRAKEIRDVFILQYALIMTFNSLYYISAYRKNFKFVDKIVPVESGTNVYLNRMLKKYSTINAAD